MSFDKRDDIVNFMRETQSGDKVITLHQGHQPEIEIAGENKSRRSWYLQDIVIHLEAG